jgi:transcriptional regulator with XRE-family HTH domain
MGVFADRLRKIRKRRRLTQVEAALRTGINNMTLSHYEAGRREPTIGNLRLICDGLEVSADWMIGRKG